MDLAEVERQNTGRLVVPLSQLLDTPAEQFRPRCAVDGCARAVGHTGVHWDARARGRVWWNEDPEKWSTAR